MLYTLPSRLLIERECVPIRVPAALQTELAVAQQAVVDAIAALVQRARLAGHGDAVKTVLMAKQEQDTVVDENEGFKGADSVAVSGVSSADEEITEQVVRPLGRCSGRR